MLSTVKIKRRMKIRGNDHSFLSSILERTLREFMSQIPTSPLYRERFKVSKEFLDHLFVVRSQNIGIAYSNTTPDFKYFLDFLDGCRSLLADANQSGYQIRSISIRLIFLDLFYSIKDDDLHYQDLMPSELATCHDMIDMFETMHQELGTLELPVQEEFPDQMFYATCIVFVLQYILDTIEDSTMISERPKDVRNYHCFACDRCDYKEYKRSALKFDVKNYDLLRFGVEYRDRTSFDVKDYIRYWYVKNMHCPNTWAVVQIVAFISCISLFLFNVYNAYKTV